MQFAPAASLQNLRSLVRGHNPLYLQQQILLGTVSHAVVQELDQDPIPAQPLQRRSHERRSAVPLIIQQTMKSTRVLRNGMIDSGKKNQDVMIAGSQTLRASLPTVPGSPHHLLHPLLVHPTTENLPLSFRDP
jgi:hypothetical protein